MCSPSRSVLCAQSGRSTHSAPKRQRMWVFEASFWRKKASIGWKEGSVTSLGKIYRSVPSTITTVHSAPHHYSQAASAFFTNSTDHVRECLPNLRNGCLGLMVTMLCVMVRRLFPRHIQYVCHPSRPTTPHRRQAQRMFSSTKNFANQAPHSSWLRRAPFLVCRRVEAALLR